MKLSKIYLLTLLLLPVIGLAQSARQKTFSISGKVADTKIALDHIIYLKFQQNGKEIKDSSKIVNGSYSFKGQIYYPVKAVLQLKVADSVEKYYNTTHFLKEYSHPFYLDQGKITAYSAKELNSTIIKGSNADADAVELENKLNPYYKKGNALYEEEGKSAYERKDSVAIAAYTRKSYARENQIDSVKKSFMLAHLQSGAAFDLLKEYTGSLLDPVEIEPLFNQLLPSLKNSSDGKMYAARIQEAKKTAIGTVAPDFVLKDGSGKDISLSSLRGKLVLLDFWGSWCYPCRASHPHLKKLYQEYKSRGFEILGVSSESGKPDDHQRWETAIKEDGMEWVNVLNNNSRGERSKGILNQYDVAVFPTKILIDKNGVILKRFAGNTPKNSTMLEKDVKTYLDSH